MLGVPAQLAGCREVVLCTPPRRDGSADPAVLYAARLLRHRRVFQARRRAGDRGDGLRHRQRAALRQAVRSRQCLRHRGQAAGGDAAATAPAIDMPAGPSEVLVIADAGANRRVRRRRPAVAGRARPRFAGGAAQRRSTRCSMRCAAQVERATGDAAARRHRARRRWRRRALIRVPIDLHEALAISNDYAPEHLILALRDARALAAAVQRAGSVFLGDWAPEALGDYCSGTNHVLPTGGAARAWSGVSVASFQISDHACRKSSRAGIAGDRPLRRASWRAPKAWMRMRGRWRCAWRRRRHERRAAATCVRAGPARFRRLRARRAASARTGAIWLNANESPWPSHADAGG